MFWVDATRILVFVLCAASFIIMGFGFYFHHACWNTKTRDYWFGRMTWNVVGMVSSSEALIRQTPFRYSLLFFLFAALATLKGNLQKGAWGTNSEEECRPGEYPNTDRLNG